MSNIDLYNQDNTSKARGAAMAGAISGVFQTLRAYYPKNSLVMKTSEQELAMMREWGRALVTAKVNQEMLRSGIERAKSYAAEDRFCNWPSLIDFISWCHGIPSPEAAWFETLKKCHDLTEWQPTHAIVALAGRQVGFFDIHNSDNKKHYKTEYVRVYAEMIVRACAGESFEYKKLDKPLQLEKHKPTAQDIQRNRAMLSDLMAAVEAAGEPTQQQRTGMNQEEKVQRLVEMRAKADEWEKSRGEK